MAPMSRTGQHQQARQRLPITGLLERGPRSGARRADLAGRHVAVGAEKWRSTRTRWWRSKSTAPWVPDGTYSRRGSTCGLPATRRSRTSWTGVHGAISGYREWVNASGAATPLAPSSVAGDRPRPTVRDARAGQIVSVLGRECSGRRRRRSRRLRATGDGRDLRDGHTLLHLHGTWCGPVAPSGCVRQRDHYPIWTSRSGSIPIS